ncbi:hypothetical protein [Streptomyces platensis]|uniref:hypothetical protein n=1 Tax=Streptomyces platensis TaxID=58346 RepID=UPI003326BDCC
MRDDMSIGHRVMRELSDAMRTGAGRVLDERYAHGFDAAAGICVSVLSDAIDGLLGKIKSGKYLSDQEQALLSRLTELKAEMEEGLRKFWESDPTGNDAINAAAWTDGRDGRPADAGPDSSARPRERR